MIIGLRFIPGLTMAGYVAIGMSDVSTIRFTGLNLLGALLWAIVLGFAGYFFGHALELLLEEIKHLEAPIFLVVLMVVMLKFIYRRFKRQRNLGKTDPGMSCQESFAAAICAVCVRAPTVAAQTAGQQ